MTSRNACRRPLWVKSLDFRSRSAIRSSWYASTWSSLASDISRIRSFFWRDDLAIRSEVADPLVVAGRERRRGIGIDEQAVDAVERVVAGGAVRAPVVGKRLVEPEDLLDHDIELGTVPSALRVRRRATREAAARRRPRRRPRAAGPPRAAAGRPPGRRLPGAARGRPWGRAGRRGGRSSGRSRRAGPRGRGSRHASRGRRLPDRCAGPPGR